MYLVLNSSWSFAFDSSIMSFHSLMGLGRLSLMIIIFSFFSEAESASFEIVNKCNYTIWPGVATTSGGNAPSLTGFTLKSGASLNLSVPNSWNGRVWGRTLCNVVSSTGNFSCFTADCGTGKVECNGNGARPPATLAEFNLNNADGGLDFYDVSVVNGFNLPMVVVPRRRRGGECIATGCAGNVSGSCPSELRVVREGYVACTSACAAFADPRYCCNRANATEETCGPTPYSEYFKEFCPRAYTYEHDDSNQLLYTCASADYRIIFCPTSVDEKLIALQAEKMVELPEAAPAESPPREDYDQSHAMSIVFISIIGPGFILTLISFVVPWRRKEIGEKNTIQKGSFGKLEDGRRFTYSEIVKITNNFASTIGAGGFGKIYHGCLENDIQVAVKLLILASDSIEFQNEVKLLMRAHHKNLVSFVGYCNDRKAMALVCEYVANGTLQQHLKITDGTTARTWTERLKIAMDVARGLDYLHNGCKPPIIHRDIKTCNILLTEKMQAKICDFGVSKLLSNESATHTLTDHIRGTRGYFDPEYYTTGMLNKKSDIYSFGIVLLELITGKPAIITDPGHQPIHICQYARPMFERAEIERIVDSRIAGTYKFSAASKAVQIAMECVASTSIERPDSIVVYNKLKECLEIEVPPEIREFPVPEIVDESDDDSGTNSSHSIYIADHSQATCSVLEIGWLRFEPFGIPHWYPLIASAQ